jgi:carboxypeptidase C (cathepsin A)
MESVNMLYIDQPVQVGFSYDILVNVTTDLLSGDTNILNPGDPIPEQNATFLIGTYPSQKLQNTAASTENAARAFWNFAQVWFQEFPGHKRDRVSLATESYGGRYGPAFFSFFESRNQKILNGTWTAKGETHLIQLDTLMLVSPCTELPVQWPSYPQQMYNNTYGIQAVNSSVYEASLDALHKPGGCLDQLYHCGNLSALYDPEDLGHNQSVNAVCSAAEAYCDNNVRSGPYTLSNRDPNDLARNALDPFPPTFGGGWLNQPHVQSALGVPLNFTVASSADLSTTFTKGDWTRPGGTSQLGYLLDNGVKVAMLHGDRDFICNWVGGEAVSLDVPYTQSHKFRNAGYAPVHTNSTYIGGHTRQHGNFSFTTVFQSGHEVPAYQGETALAVLTRVLRNMDVSTGTVNVTLHPQYTSQGPSDISGLRQQVPEPILGYCYLWFISSLCTTEETEAIANGSAVIKDWIVVDHNSEILFPEVVGNLTKI